MPSQNLIGHSCLFHPAVHGMTLATWAGQGVVIRHTHTLVPHWCKAIEMETMGY